jgi:nitrogenase molybdenum-iron protein NifN
LADPVKKIRLGAAHEVSVGYRGTRNLIFAIGNMFIERAPEPTPDSWNHNAPVPEDSALATDISFPLAH